MAVKAGASGSRRRRSEPGDRNQIPHPAPARSLSFDVAGFDAMLFDMDGVITQSARLHSMLWKQVFDDFLQVFSERNNVPFRPFDAERDYHDFVDGKPRYDGVLGFLASRAIMIPFGEPTDDETTDTCCGIGNHKNRLFLEHLARDGMPLFDSTVQLIRDLRARGKLLAVVSSSKNTESVLRKAGLFELFDVNVSGREAAAMSLAGKPAPDTYIKAAELLNTAPSRSIVFEDSVVGVQAGKSAGAGLVVGVDRGADRAALLWHGADLVVDDLGDLKLE